MKKLFALLAAIFMAASISGPLEARPLLRADFSVDRPLQHVKSSCYDAGQRAAKKRRARLLRADETGDGKCRVVLLVPGGKGGRPRREEITVSMR